ncbi:MAG: hypothetical protein H7061_13055 [Bdellovibrionaceae bacterium]|nr:hypothetical protein [Bdellovibrio sp.]
MNGLYLRPFNLVSRWLVVITLLTISVTSQADLKTNFALINKTYKGPFGMNVLQGPTARIEIKAGGTPGHTQFQAAYRNQAAQALALEENFWTGNLFTTNYYELMGEYVYGDANSNHELDHSRLVAAGPKAMPKAASMMRHWALEKHYVSYFPRTKLAESYLVRGISDMANEREYANYFFGFYLTAMTEELQYLPAFLVINKSPMIQTASLDKARELVAVAYDSYLESQSVSEATLKDMYRLRNAIHNQMGPEVVGLIENFLNTYPELKNDQYFTNIQSILVEYFRIDFSKISAQAKKLGLSDLLAVILKASKKSTDVDTLAELARVSAVTRIEITSKLSFEKRGQGLALLAEISKVLNKELSALSKLSVKSPTVAKAIIDLVFLEGFLLKDNWEYFSGETKTSSNLASLLKDVLEAATDSLATAFKPSFSQWLIIEPKMQGFMDNTIKSSSLGTVAVTIEKLK